MEGPEGSTQVSVLVEGTAQAPTKLLFLLPGVGR